MEPLWHRQQRDKQIALLARKNRWYRYEEMKNNLSQVLDKSSAKATRPENILNI